MIYWNNKTIKSHIASIVWNISEFTGIGLGRYAPIIFGLMIDRKGRKF